MECRICLQPCYEVYCRCVSAGYKHRECLEKWMEMSGNDERCELCLTEYKMEERFECRPHRFMSELCVLSSDVNGMLYFFVVFMSFVFCCILPGASEWLPAVVMWIVLQLIFVLVCVRRIYPFMTLFYLNLYQLIGLSVVYWLRDDKKMYPVVFGDFDRNRVRILDAFMILGCMTVLSFVLAFVELVLRTCKRRHVCGGEYTSLL